MSTASSENDVIRTRIPTYDDDNTVLYAYEPNIAFFREANVVPETPTDEDNEKTVKDVLAHCQVIHDAIQNLDRKFDVIHGKVSKIQRHRSKSFWQRRPKGCQHRQCQSLLIYPT
ncbi:PREDICTED: sex comb on midleg-like protein 1 [Chrysochloris asiatica]|uniref:Sex comb on midleg-like protein 1 n=1 Tax=Chrysochloris asiatica TaxID=185453 RepID=A0A9B0WI50_CHRAS|nr:PREDICTED: sex comb on midleg-like protein 1 [Chrysochloris asiatica]